MLPIGVIIPTRNSMSLLPAHVDMMRPWVANVAEVVVVDSASEDGTSDYLKANLRHPHLRFFQHPPGLYQSWNFGLAQIQAPYAYISSIGDSISGDGLAHMHEVAERLKCDVVVSRPEFLDAQRQPLHGRRWPPHDLCETLGLQEPAVVAGLELFVFALTNISDALLGNSASDLHRTTSIQARPFPTDYGTSGDAAWGLQHALDIRMGVATKVFSSMLDHPKTYNARDYAVVDLAGRLVQLGIETAQTKRRGDSALDQRFRAAGLDALLSAMTENLAAQRKLERFRRQHIPWVLNPLAWQARLERASARTKLNRLKLECLRRPGAISAAGRTGDLSGGANNY